MTTDQQKTSQNFYLTIFLYVKEHNRLPDLSISKQALGYYVKVLKRANLLKKIGYGTWEVNGEYNEQQIKTAKTSQKKTTLCVPRNYPVRAHAFQFKLNIPKIDNWHKREEYLKKNNIAYTQSPIKALGQQIFLNGSKIWLTDKSVVIHAKSQYLAESAKDGKNYAIADMLSIISNLESLLNCSFKEGKRYNFKVTRQHYAKMRDELAKQYRRDGKKLFVHDGKGIWLWIDFSEGIDELETGNREDSDRHMDNKVIRMFNEVKEHDEYMPSNLHSRIADLASLIEGVTKNQGIFDANMQSHIQAVQSLSKGVEQLTIGINEFRQSIKMQKTLEFIKKNVKSINDLINYKEYVQALSQPEIEDLQEWLAHRFSA